MDPNENLKEQLETADRIIQAVSEERFVHEGEAETLAELVLALDEWLKNGGFLPEEWRKGQNL
jgi:hypothetical protein